MLSPYEADHQFFRHCLRELGTSVTCADTRAGASNTLRSESVSAVVCERDLPDASWHEVLEDCGRTKSHPPVIVVSRHADEMLWAEVLNLGGFDVLMKPLDHTEAVRVISMAQRRGSPQRTHEGSA